ncbi:MAG TPA: cyclic nucleotide-binding domain-containing protein [Polyangiaceae bacterium]|jgi:cAMP-dependent protein kinase regulator|nr:cyclic nucleotide-binding domain-containing protein [Polyangiaceae bacterium]
MRVAPPDLPGAQNSDSPIDRALALLLANETEAALRWAASAVERAPSMPSGLVITCRLLEQMGRPEAAIEGFKLAVRRAIDGANLPLAVAAIGDLRALGVDVTDDLDALASAFCMGSDRLTETEAPPPPLPNFEGFQPLSSFLTGPALTSKATQIVHAAKRDYDEATDGAEMLLTAPLPLFSAMPKEALRDLLAAFEMITVPAGQPVIQEGEEGSEAYIVARGELEVLRDGGEEKPPIMLARLVAGALFGEMALLSRAPRAASVVATRPSILLVAKREALETVAEGRPEVAVELAAHCRRRMVANLGRTSPVLVAVPPQERTMLVERFETRIYEKGEKLVTQGEDAAGLHLVASGQVAVVAHDGEETVMLSALSPGETVGEVALVLRRKANADVIAVHPTVTLFLPREEFMSLVHDHPGVLHGLYMTAVRRDDETAVALDNAPAAVADDYVLL